MTLSLKATLRYAMLTLIGLIAIFAIIMTAMWHKNQSISHPLPFQDSTTTSNAHEITSNSPASSQSDIRQTLNIIASPNLKPPLDEVLERFSHRYSHISSSIHYIETSKMQNYLQSHSDIQLVLADAESINHLKKSNTALNDAGSTNLDTSNLDSNGKIDSSNQTLNTQIQQQLATFNVAYETLNQTNSPVDSKEELQSNTSNSKLSVNKKRDNQPDFNSMLTTDKLIQGYIIDNSLADTFDSNEQNSAIISFRQFILASNIQKLLNTADINSIESYRNGVADLFNRNSQTLEDAPDNPNHPTLSFTDSGE